MILWRASSGEVSRNEHQADTSVWTMETARSIRRQEMPVDTVDFNVVFRLACPWKVGLGTNVLGSGGKSFDLLGSRIGRQSNLFKHHMRKRETFFSPLNTSRIKNCCDEQE